jgi:predicted secreted protein
VSSEGLDAHQLRLLTKKVRDALQRIVTEKQPIDIEDIYLEIERDDTCTPWRKHYWQSSKWAVQAEWKHKIRTYLQARDKGRKLFKYVKGEGWKLSGD